VSKVAPQAPCTAVNADLGAPAHALLDQLGRHPELHGLGIAVAHIVGLVDGAQSAIPELTQAIMAEPFIAQKCLRVANVALSRYGSTPVTTLSKAIVVLGLEQVRTLALSALLLGRLKNKRQALHLEGEFASVIYASTLAREIAAGQRLCQPEEAAVCALFRSFGRLVIALYRYESYERIRALSIEERINDNQAAVRVLGLSFDRLGVELLTRWSFPQRILLALAPCPEPIRFSTNVEVRLQILSAFCMELALRLWESNLSARRQAIETLLQRFGPGLRLERQHLRVHLQLVDAQAEEMSQALGLSAYPATGEVFDDLSTLTFSPLNRPGASLILSAGLVTLNRMLQQNHSSDTILKRACDIFQRAFNFQRVAAYSALVQSQAFSLRAVAGKPCNVNARTQYLQSAVQDGVVREALVKNVNVYLRSRNDDALGQSWEPWFSLFPDANSFFVLPIVGGDRLLGVIYADYPRSNEQGWTSEELDAVEAIKRAVRLALQAERALQSPRH
jgi:HD-like signal output (HDOD) protein